MFRKSYFIFIGVFVVGCNVQNVSAMATLDIDAEDKYVADECKGSEVDLTLQSLGHFAPIRQSLEVHHLREDMSEGERQNVAAYN